jgi:hypothetical protein
MTQGRHQGIQGFIGRPLDSDEQLRHKLGEIAKLQRLAVLHPEERCYKLAIERVQNELNTLRSVDGSTNRRKK